jgi:hypothetical protein
MIYTVYLLIRNIIQKQKNKTPKPSPDAIRRRMTESTKSLTLYGVSTMKDQIPKVSIKTLEQAKDYFMFMECSPFHMAREYPKRYKEYMELHIPEQTENKWRKERFYEIYSGIMSSSDKSFLWHLHWRMSQLYGYIRSNEELLKILEATKYLFDNVPNDDRIIIAETINGGTNQPERQGLLYMAYDSGNIEVAKEFAKLSLLFSGFTDNNKNERNQRSIQLCHKIMDELGLK